MTEERASRARKPGNGKNELENSGQGSCSRGSRLDGQIQEALGVLSQDRVGSKFPQARSTLPTPKLSRAIPIHQSSLLFTNSSPTYSNSICHSSRLPLCLQIQFPLFRNSHNTYTHIIVTKSDPHVHRYTRKVLS